MRDREGRVIDYLRISLTDRCNLRCKYCMPAEGIPLMNHDDILRYEEIIRFVNIASTLGIKKIRLTGGEPLLRKNIAYLIKELKGINGIEEVSITTNGILLSEMMDALVEAGLDRINLSLDTLQEGRFEEITRFNGFNRVYDGMLKALKHGLKVKVNVVLIKDKNDDEILDFVGLTKKLPVDVRFIELMPIGCGAEFTGVENAEVIEIIKKSKLRIVSEKVRNVGNGPASYYKIENAKGNIGFISPMSHQFCGDCNRIRLTAEGFMKPCLHSKNGVDMRALLRGNETDQSILNILEASIHKKPTQHQFKEISDEKDVRSMNQIGG